jgi:hypothetical protein
MEKTLKSIDIGPIGTITRFNGEVIGVPRLTNLKLIKIAKFLGIDGMKLYDRYKEIVEDPFVTDSEKWMTILSELPEETVVHLLSILMDMDDKETLSLDPVETLEIIDIYVDNLNIGKAFTIVRNLAKKMFNKELPDIFKKTDGEVSSAS